MTRFPPIRNGILQFKSDWRWFRHGNAFWRPMGFWRCLHKCLGVFWRNHNPFVLHMTYEEQNESLRLK